MRTPLVLAASVATILSVACTGVPQPGSHDHPDASDTGSESDTEPQPTMTSMPDWKLSWAVRAGGDEHDDPNAAPMFREIGDAIAPLPEGSIYFAGQVAEAAVFGAGEPNETSFPDEDIGWSDGFLARYGADGKLAWVRRIGGEGEDHVFDVAALDDGSAVVVGRFDSSEIVLGQGEPKETTLASNNPVNAYAARYALNGDLVWAIQIPKSETDFNYMYAYVVKALPDGRLLVAGMIHGTAWPGEANEIASLPSETDEFNWDGFLSWLDAEDGAVQHAVRIGGDYQCMVHSVDVTEEGDVIVALYYDGDEIFGLGEAKETTLHCGCQFGCTSLARYDGDGRLEWAHDLGLDATAATLSITLLEGGNIGLAARFGRAEGFDGDGGVIDYTSDPDNRYGAVVASYRASDGALQWARFGVNRAPQTYGMAISINALPGGGMLAGFTFDDTLTFDGQDSGQQDLVSAGDHDLELMHLLSDGEIVWMHRLGNAGKDVPAASAQLDGTSLWLTGAYGSDPFIATSGNGDDIALPLSGYTDVFLMRFDSTAPPAE